MAETTEREQGEARVNSADSSTMQTSQDDQARGYLNSLTEGEFITELQRALESANRLTDKTWKVVVSADGVEIQSKAPDEKRIKIPKPKGLKN